MHFEHDLIRKARVMSLEKWAIKGGKPAVQSPLPVWPPQIAAIAASVQAAMSDGSWGQYHGRPIDDFTTRWAADLAVAHVRPCSSGTIGIELALRGCGVRPGQTVVLSAYDFPGNFRAIESVGARPVLIDVIEGGWTINARRIPEAFSADTGAVLVSHLHGALLDMNWIAEICREANIPLVEDACQVPGATVCGKPAGTHGDAGVFSFGGSKLLTAGRGGAVVTDRDDVNQRMAIAADRGNDAFPLSALQAAALLPQLDMLNEFNARRLQNARRLRQSLQSSRLFQVLDEEWNEVNRPSFYKFPLLVRDGHERTAILAALQGEGIPADIGFLGFARRAPRRCQAIGDLCNSVRAARQLILLHHPLLLGDDRLIDQVLKGFAKIETGFSV